MKILYINHYAGSVYHGMEYRPYYLAREWVKIGHEVFIVASSYSHLRQKNIYSENDFTNTDNQACKNKVSILGKKKGYFSEFIDGINYIWCKTISYKGNGIGRFINIFNFLYKIYKIIDDLIALKPDLIIASSTYPFDVWVAKAIARRSGAKFVYEVHDLWPLTLIELNNMSLRHPFIWLMQKAEDYGYRNADKVVSLLPNAFNYMQEHGLNKKRFITISNGVVVDDWLNNSQQQSQGFKKLQQQIAIIKKQYSFLVGYAGGMGQANALIYLLEVAAHSKLQDTAFVLIGDGPLKAHLLDVVAQKRLKNIFVFPSIIKSDVPHFLRLMDALYIGWNKLPIYRFGISPNKLFDYMLSAKPIVHSVTAGNDLVADANCGISVAAADIPAIVTAILHLKSLSKEQLNVMGENGYRYVTKNCDYKYLAGKFIAEVFELPQSEQLLHEDQNPQNLVEQTTDQSPCMKKTRVCHITSVHRRDDIRIFVKECNALARSGFEVFLIVADGKGEQAITLEDGIAQINIIDVGVESSRFGRMINTPKKIFRQIQQINPYIVHFHDPELMLLGLKLKSHNIKVVYDVHEDLPKQILSKYWIPRFIRPFISLVARQVECYVAKRIAGVICATPMITDRFKRYNANTVTICNYPKLSELEIIDIPWSERNLDLCYIGSISKARGIEPLIDSLALCDLDLELAGILSGDVNLDLLKKKDSKQHINYHGVLSRSQIVQLLSRVRVGVVTLLPTPSYIESLPIKLFEYMYEGITVVASNFDFWQHFVLKYDCGMMVDPHSCQQIADACSYLINNPDIAKQMGQNGRKAVITYFNWEEQVKILVAYYQRNL